MSPSRALSAEISSLKRDSGLRKFLFSIFPKIEVSSVSEHSALGQFPLLLFVFIDSLLESLRLNTPSHLELQQTTFFLNVEALVIADIV